MPRTNPTHRDPRLDVLRGLALVMIFINHVPGNLWTNTTSRNFGFSDAAEGFVLIAGLSAALAYGRWFRSPLQFQVGLGRIWGRVWTLYLVQIFITVLALGLTVGLAGWFGDPSILNHNKVDLFLADPGNALLRLPLLIQHLDYFDILPMYIVLLFFTPFALILAWRWPLALFGASVGLWWVAVTFRINLPNHGNPSGWFFNPLAWQILFVIGLLAGTAMQQGRRLVPRHPALLALAGGYLGLSLVWLNWQPLGDSMGGLLWQAEQAGVPRYLTTFDKTFLPVPRLLHILALAYVLSAIGGLKQVCTARYAAPFGLLGRQGLLVFAAGSVIAVGLQSVRLQTGGDAMTDTIMLAGGLAGLFALAALQQYWPKA